MSIKSNSPFLTVAIVFVFILSGVLATPVYADESLPPTDVPAETQAEETAPQESNEEEAPPLPTGETESAPSEESTLDEEQPILEQLPENTEIIVLDEDGEAIPLATQEAQEAIEFIDPVWCPVGVAPQDNLGGCTIAYGSLKELIDALMAGTAGVVPNTAGVIWIEDGADSSTGNILLDGSDTSLGDMENFALTFQGGWNGTFGSKTIVGTSTFSDRITITGWNAAITINDIIIDTATGDGLTVTTTGNIVLKNVQSNNNTGRGATLDNSTGAGNVTITNSKFNNNGGAAGLTVISKGTITIKDLTANDNTNYGANLDNDSATTAKTVTLSGSNTFNANGSVGLFISSVGAITVNNISANNNSTGTDLNNALLINGLVPATAGITLTGTNIFNDNTNAGINILSYGIIKVNNLFANSNDGNGAFLSNSGATVGKPGVTLTGTNEFKYNVFNGLFISTNGPVSVNNVSANTNTQTGVSINNLGLNSATTFTGTNAFNDNGYSGLVIQSAGQVTLSNITANGNGTAMIAGYGVSISNQTLTSFKGVTLTGTNSFSNNYNSNLIITSSGAVTLNNLTANYSNNGFGVSINNTSSGVSKPMAVTINGTNNSMTHNGLSGLDITTYGSVTLNNINASNNGQDMAIGHGAFVINSGSTLPQLVNINGTNKFDDNYEYGLLVVTKGNVTTNNITAFSNNIYGAFIQNTAGTGNVTMTGTNKLTFNGSDNLFIQSAGMITLNNITADSSTTGYGGSISNTSAATPKNITINGTNSFSNNSASTGLLVVSNGLITVNNITANNNFDTGAYLYNGASSTKAGVTVNGTNTFNNNPAGYGLRIVTLGNVKTNSVTAKSNGGHGLWIQNISPTTTGNVTMTGTNVFESNTVDNVYIEVYGAVTLSNINSTFATSGGTGLYIDNTLGTNTAPKPVSLTGTNVFSNNASSGLIISTYGAITTNNLTVVSNGGLGAEIYNTGTATGKAANVTLNGNNFFSANNDTNLYIESDGLIKGNNITANDSASSEGAFLINNSGIAGVILTGTNTFSSNFFTGLVVYTKGAITINNLNASTNGIDGTHLDNAYSGFAAPKPVTLTGSNSFTYNNRNGLEIDSYGNVTTNNLTASYNGILVSGEHGVHIDTYRVNNTIIANVTLNGNNTFESQTYGGGLIIEAFGIIKVNNLTANNNGDGSGAFLDNQNSPSNAYGVTLTGKVTVNDNSGSGLYIISKGAILLNNLTALNNNLDGVFLDNTLSGTSTPKPITLTGINITSNNTDHGFEIYSYGVVTINKITANQNNYGGRIINQGGNPSNAVIAGYGVFDSNSIVGLTINSQGAVLLTNITANNTSVSSGVMIDNTFGTSGITLTGTNTFTTNASHGISLSSNGAITITKITADNNSGSGLFASNSSTVTITCGSFTSNAFFGWRIDNATLVTMNGVFTAGNGTGDYSTPATVVFTRACPLP